MHARTTLDIDASVLRPRRPLRARATLDVQHPLLCGGRLLQPPRASACPARARRHVARDHLPVLARAPRVRADRHPIPAIVDVLLSPDAASADIDDRIRRPQIVVAGEGERFWPGLKSLARAVQPGGALVPDTHLVALMREHGVAQVWSDDPDFGKFDGITAPNPFDVRYATGFD